MLVGTLHRRNGFYTVQTVHSIPYTNPTPKPTHHTKLSAFLHFQRIINPFPPLGLLAGSHNVLDLRFYHACGDHTHTTKYACKL